MYLDEVLRAVYTRYYEVAPEVRCCLQSTAQLQYMKFEIMGIKIFCRFMRHEVYTIDLNPLVSMLRYCEHFNFNEETLCKRRLLRKYIPHVALGKFITYLFTEDPSIDLGKLANRVIMVRYEDLIELLALILYLCCLWSYNTYLDLSRAIHLILLNIPITVIKECIELSEVLTLLALCTPTMTLDNAPQVIGKEHGTYFDKRAGKYLALPVTPPFLLIPTDVDKLPGNLHFLSLRHNECTISRRAKLSALCYDPELVLRYLRCHDDVPETLLEYVNIKAVKFNPGYVPDLVLVM